jgi:toxin ParE1/3/4
MWLWSHFVIRRLDVLWDDGARADLQAIFDYVAEASQNFHTAFKFVTRIEARCEKIGDIPHIGTARNDILPGLRIVPFERSAVILYMLEANRIRITNIFYGGRDYEALMRKAI